MTILNKALNDHLDLSYILHVNVSPSGGKMVSPVFQVILKVRAHFLGSADSGKRWLEC